MRYPALARPLALGPVVLRNRVVSAPMERNYSTPDGEMTRAYIDYLAARAEGGAALVFSEASYVRADGRGRARQAGVAEDRHIPGLAAMAAAVHEHGAKAGVELNHGGRTVRSRVSGLPPVAPSAVPCPPAGGDMPAVLGGEEVHDLVECYGKAARRCREAGVDVLSVHAAHGYLVHQFLSPLTNLRTDEFADPLRFLDLVLAAVRNAAPELCVGIRISAFEGVPGGLDAARTLELVRAARLDLIDFIDVSAGNYEAAQWMVQPGEWPPGILADHAEPYRTLGLPVGVAGRISDPQVAEEVVVRGRADFVSMARALHADPRWPRRVLAGEPFRPCIACNVCIDSLHGGAPVPCSVNPDVGVPEPRRSGTARPSSRHGPSGGVVVVGGGPAGLETARLAAGRGLKVRLLERESRLGGRFRLAAALHCNPGHHRVLDWYAGELDRLGVEVRTGVAVDAAVLASLRPDAVVLATGRAPRLPEVEGAGPPNVTEIAEWLREGGEPPEQCTIWGADQAAMAVADDIAVHGGRVQIIAARETPAPEVGPRARMLPIARLAENPAVRILLGRRVVRVGTDHLVVRGPAGREEIAAPGPVLVSPEPAPGPERPRWLPANTGTPLRLVGEAAGVPNSLGAVLRDAVSVAGTFPAEIG
ncbi:FAD-dependent oxidoreductase [Actinomadura luteofluorescens]|uniref:oxidoreductase n=1 Tax=Actinomadura luteofluorescens TaxID=46163 RepID=UPI0030CEF19A